MSAFYDIWISTDKTSPASKRNRNKNWAEQQNGLWLSVPEQDKDFYKSASSGDYNLLLIGQLYERKSIESVLQDCIQYIEHHKPYKDPAGHYILFITNSSSLETFVFTNRMGSYHAYWSTDGKISTNYTILAKSIRNKTLDWEGITGFMGTGYFPDDKTYLTEINIFEPASCYHFDNQLTLIDKVRYYSWLYNPQEKPTTYYLEQLRGAIQESLQTSVAGYNTCVPISGGLDSRLLAGEITSEAIKYKDMNAISYGYTSSSDEITIAKKVAESRSIPIHSYVLPNYLFDELDEIGDAVELFQYVDGTRQASARGWLGENADIVVGGHWGDVWMNNMNISNSSDLMPAFQKKIIKKGSAWLLKEICKPKLENPDEYLEEYFRSYLKRYRHIDDADFIFKLYKTEQWSHRWTAASIRMYQAASFPVLPFYDNRVTDVFTTIPTHVIKNRQLEIEYLKTYFSELARIKWQEYDANLYNYKYLNNRNPAYRVAKKIGRSLSAQKPIQRNWEVFYLNPSGKKHLEKILLNNDALNNLVSQQKTTALLDDLQKHPTAENGYAVSMLLTFAIFLDKIFS